MMGKWFFNLAWACLLTTTAAFPKVPKVLIVGMDGLRSRALLRDDTPVLDSLMQAGIHSYRTRSDTDTRGGSGWASLLTGVADDNHGVHDDQGLEQKRVLYPNLFDHLKNGLPGLHTAAIVGREALGRNILYDADTLIMPGSDRKVELEALHLLAGNGPDALLLQFGTPQRVGGIFGFNPGMPFYRWAVREADRRLGRILCALRNRPGYAEEDWLIIVTAVLGTGPRADEDEFFLASAEGMASLDLGAQASVLDVVPTVLYHFSLLPQPHFIFAGRPAQEGREHRIEAIVLDGSYILQ